MTKKDDNEQNIKIVGIEKDIEILKERLRDNFEQHTKDFYPKFEALLKQINKLDKKTDRIKTKVGIITASITITIGLIFKYFF